MSIEQDVRDAEQARIDALIASDYFALGVLLTDDLVHIHANGSIEDKTTYLATIEAKIEFVEIMRPSFDVRHYGDIAIATGLLNQTVRVKGPGVVVSAEVAVTQLWVAHGGGWQLASFQATKLDPH